MDPNSTPSEFTPFIIKGIDNNQYIIGDREVTYNSAYNPNQMRLAYKTTPIEPLPNKKRVVITVVAGCHYPYLNECFLKFVQDNSADLTPLTDDTKLEVINLNKTGNDVSYNSDYLSSYIQVCTNVQWAHAMNPNAHIRVVEPAKINDFGSLLDAVTYASTETNFNNPSPSSTKYNKWGPTDIIIMSWGVIDSSVVMDEYQVRINNINNMLNQYDCFYNNKICYLASSGDGVQPNYPSTHKNILSVGGTTFNYNQQTNELEQTAWDKRLAYKLPYNNSGACGPSSNVLKPEYQKNITSLNFTKNRCCPDVACVADLNSGIRISFRDATNLTNYLTGGTALSCSITGGILSNVVQQFINENKTITTVVNTGGGANDSFILQELLYNKIYNNGNSPYYKKCFYNVTKGNVAGYEAGINYNIPTGLGSILGDELLKALKTEIYPVSTVGFLSGAQVKTDQGLVYIQDLNSYNNTINGKKILAVAKTLNLQNYLVVIEKNAIRKNLPNNPITLSPEEFAFIYGSFIKAYKIYDRINNIKKVYHKLYTNNEILYSIILESPDTIHINNLRCNSLSNEHIIAKLYTNTITDDERAKIQFEELP